jgi:hypothetical protein
MIHNRGEGIIGDDELFFDYQVTCDEFGSILDLSVDAVRVYNDDGTVSEQRDWLYLIDFQDRYKDEIEQFVISAME